ncbi:unnamed protein product [Rhizophagus irregularis]|nr:unnamed protein product [Rhizophagus irregularis]
MPSITSLQGRFQTSRIYCELEPLQRINIIMSETNTPTSTSILHQEMRRLEIKKYGELILFLKEQNLGLSETALKILENEEVNGRDFSRQPAELRKNVKRRIFELEATLKIKNDEPEAWRQRATLNEEKVDELKARNANLEVENSDLKNKVVKLEQEHKVRTVGEQSQVKTRSVANTKTCEASERQKKNVGGEIQSNSGRIVETVTKSHDQIEPKVDTGNSDNTTEVAETENQIIEGLIQTLTLCCSLTKLARNKSYTGFIILLNLKTDSEALQWMARLRIKRQDRKYIG